MSKQEAISNNRRPRPAGGSPNDSRRQKIIDPRRHRGHHALRWSRYRPASFPAPCLCLSPSTKLEGKSRPQIRKYRANFSTSLARRVHRANDPSASPSVAPAGKTAARSTYGVDSPAVVTALDPNRPVWDRRISTPMPHRLLHAALANKVSANSSSTSATRESGRPNQRVSRRQSWTYRIVDPQFILSATFEL